MTRAELIAETRAAVRDLLAPYAWSDDRLVRWLSEAQDKFCVLTGFWSDSTTFTITTVAGQQTYQIPDRINSVRSIYIGTRRLIELVGAVIDTDDFEVSNTQSPIHYRIDLDAGVITIVEPVVAGEVMNLRVHRNSLVPLSRKTSTITLSGTFLVGDVITATINGIVFSHATTIVDANLSGVATALAGLINADKRFVAQVSGQVVSIATTTTASTTTTAVVVSTNMFATAADAYTAEPEIPSQFHSALVEYAAAKAFRDHDADRQDPVKAADNLSAFMNYVAEGREAYRRITGEYSDVIPNPLYVV